MKRKLICFLFAAMAFHALEYESVWADGKSRNVNVTVPATINAVFNEDGSNSISEYSVNNQSLVPVHIDNVNSTEKNGWSLVPKGEKILKDQKKVSLSINNHSILSGDNEVNIAIPEESTTPLNIDIGRGAYGFDVKGSAFDLSLRYRVGQKDFNLIFDCNGGDPIESVVSKNGEKVELPTPSRDGWTFKGWTDSKGVVYQAGESFTVPIGGETLTAKWIENTSTLIAGNDFRNIIVTLRNNSTIKYSSIEFTSYAVPEDKVGNAKLVSTLDSNFKSYAYIDGDTLYISPEKDGCKIFANPNASYMFTSVSNIKKIDVSNLNTSRVTRMNDMFSYSSELLELDLSNFNTENVTTMRGMFSGCRSLLSIVGLDNFNTSSVTDAYRMFYDCSKLKELNLSSFDTSSITNMNEMFYFCSSIQNITFSDRWDTSKVKNMSYMFASCSSLTQLDLSNWDVSSVSNFKCMFYYCTNLSSLNLSEFRVTSASNLNSMFSYCSSLGSLDLSNWDVSNCSDISSMFKECSKLESINLSNWDTSSVTDLNSMFYRCEKLTKIDGIGDFETGKIKNMSNIFYSCSSLAELDLSNWDTSGVTDMSYMFYICSKLTSLDVSSFDTSMVTTMYGMFGSCSSLTTLDLSNFDTSNVERMSYMFKGCSKLKSIDVSSFDTSKVLYMGDMFSQCESLKSLDLSNFDTSKVKYMGDMFSYCYNLSNIIGISDFDVSSVTSFDSMFHYAYGLRSLDLSKWDTSNATNMRRMFNSSWNLSKIIGLEDFKTHNVTDMSNMLSDIMTSSFDLSSWDVSNVKNMSGMFYNCYKTKSINLSNWDTSNVVNMSDMFRSCRDLSKLDITGWNTSKVNYIGRMFDGCVNLSSELTISNPSIASYGEMFNKASTSKGSKFVVKYSNDETKALAEKMVATKSSDSNVYLFDPEAKLVSGTNFSSLLPSDATSVKFTNSKIPKDKISGATLVSKPDSVADVYLWKDDSSETLVGKLVGWLSGDTNKYYVSPKDEGVIIFADSNCSNMFSGKTNLTKINLENFDSSRVVNMSSMFRNCSSLVSLNGIVGVNVSKFNTSKVTNMSSMFDGCSSLVSLDLSNFNTELVNNMYLMFSNCRSLSALNVSSFDTSKVTNMGFMFNNCGSLSELDLSNFNTSTVDTMQDMFANCSKLTSLNVSRFDTGRVTNMQSMFKNCSLLTGLNLDNFDTSNVSVMNYMFQGCSSLRDLDVNHFDDSSLTAAGGMFNGCSSLVSLDLSNWDTPVLRDMNSMFLGCSKLSDLNISNFNTSNVFSMSATFRGCKSLKELDLSHFNTQNVSITHIMFLDCSALTSLNISGWSNDKLTNASGMFKGCSSLTNLDLSNFNTPVLNNTQEMFSTCTSLTSLDLSSWNVSNVTNMSSMFSWSSNLTKVNVDNWDTSNVTNFNSIFAYCRNLKNLNLGHLSFASSNDVHGMFYGCNNLSGEIVINGSNIRVTTSVFGLASTAGGSRFVVKYVDDSTKEIARKLVDTKSPNSNVVLYESEGTLIGGSAFKDKIPSDATSIKFTNSPIPQDKIAGAEIVSTSDSFEKLYLWKEDSSDSIISKIVRWFSGRSGDVNRYCISPSKSDVIIYANSSCSGMFKDKNKLIEINLENFDTSRVIDIGGMFGNCSSLVSIHGIEDLNVSKVKNMYYTFGGCSSYKSAIDLGNWDTSSLVNMESTFHTSGFSEIDLSNWDVSKVDNMYGTFLASKVGVIKFDGWDASPTNRIDSMFRSCVNLREVSGFEDLSFPNVTRIGSLFFQCSSLESIVLPDLSAGAVSDIARIFNGCSSLRSVDVSKLNTSRVTDMSSAFDSCSKLTSIIGLDNWDTSNVTTMSCMFRNCESLVNLDVSEFNTENVTIFNNFLHGCKKLSSIDVSNFNTSKVKDFNGMFESCESLRELNLSNFNTSSATSMVWTFANCKSLTTLDLSNFDTSNVTTMEGMFILCSNLTEIKGLNFFNTLNVTDMGRMFESCLKLKSLDLSSFKTNNVKYMHNMFRLCQSLTSLDVSMFDTSKVTNMSSMFVNCSSLTSLNLENFNTSNVSNMTYMFSGCSNLGSLNVSSFDMSRVSNVSNMLSHCYSVSGEITISNPSITSYGSMFTYSSTAPGSRFVVKYTNEETKKMAEKLVATKSSNSNVVLYKSEGKLVSGSEFNALIPEDATSITFSNEGIPSEKVNGAILVSTDDSFEKLYLWKEDVSNSLVSKFKRLVTGRSGDVHRYKVSAKKPDIIIYANEDCSDMFNDRVKMISINFENFNTSKSNNMSRMFNGCTKLASVEGVTAFNTSNVTNMEAMFCNCNSLTSLNLANWNTSNVTTMSQMFNYADHLEELILTGWNTSNVTITYGMFGRLSNIKVLDLSSFNTSNVTDMRYMFDYCFKLENIIGLESFNMSKVKTTANMFDRCYKIKSLDLSRWDTSMVDNMSYMFLDCLDLVEIKGLNSLNTSKVTNMAEMFKGCRSMTSVDLTGWNTSSVTNMTEMFATCDKLSGGITIMNPNMVHYDNMFKNAFTRKGSKFIVRYADGCEEMAKRLISTKSENSNVYLYEDYSITFELNDGQFAESLEIPSIYSVDSETITLPTPSREGYDFSGWFTSNELTGDASTEIPSGSIGNKTFYAKWTPKKYNVTFNDNYVDGENLYNKHNIDVYDVSKWYYSNYTCTYEPVIDYSIPSGRYMKLTIGENYNGSEIGGPYLERLPLEVGKVYTWEADIRVSRDGIVGSVGPEQGGDIDSLALSTEWKTYKNTFTASDRGVNAFVFYFYNSNINVGDEIHVTNIKLVEGSAGSNTESKDYDSEIGNLPTPSREGYSFLGWYDSVVGGNKIESTTKVPLNGVTYYAHWQPNKCNITLNDNYANGDNLAPHAHDLAYWRFNSTINTGKSSLSLKDDDTLESGKYIEVNLGPAIDNSHVGLFYNGLPSSLENGKTYTWSINVKASKPGVLSHIGHEQAGYLYNSEIDTEWKTITHTFVANTSYSHRAFVVYYNKGAFDEGDKIYLSDLKLIEGSPSTNVVAKDYGSVVGELPTPRREGYSFLGWYDKPFGGNRVDNLIKVPLNGVNYYAQWSINSHVNEIHHWIWGFERGEGQNHNKLAFNIGLDRFNSVFGRKFMMDPSRAVEIPNGFKLADSFGNGEISGVWDTYPMSTEVTQVDNSMRFEYDYTPISYNITYNLNGGTNSPNNPSTYNVLYGLTLENPTKPNYTFAGWYIGNKRVDGINVGADAQFSSIEDVYNKLSNRTTGDITLSASWIEDAHIVSYDVQGGSINSVGDNLNNYKIIPNGVYGIQSNYIPEYYIHVYLAQFHNGSKICTHPTLSSNAKQTLWTFERYKDTPYYYIQSVHNSKLWELDGAYPLGTVSKSSAVQLWSQFNGDTEKDFLWCLVPNLDGSIKIKNLATGAVIGLPNGTTSANVPLEQQDNNPSVKYQSWNLVEIDLKDYPDRIKQFGGTLYINSSVPVKNGYTFAGWNTKQDGSGTMYQPGDAYSHDQQNGVVTLYAQWNPNTYTVVYNSNNASGSMDNQSMTVGEDATLSPNAFNNNAHRFTGWNTSPYGTGTSYSECESVRDLLTEGSLTLYAQWEPVEINFNFNPNNGSDTFTRSGVLGDMVDIESPSKDGHTFKGWDRSAYYGLFGKMNRLADFRDGSFGIVRGYRYGSYNHLGYGDLELVESSKDNPIGSGHEVKITATAPILVGSDNKKTYLGFATDSNTVSNKSYVHTFIAKIPKGVKVEAAFNSLGVGAKVHWYTEQYGTGDWETYSYIVELKSNASHSALGYIYVSGIDESAVTLPFSWNLASSKIMEVTDVTTDPVFLLGSGDSDLTAQWVSNSETHYLNVQGKLDGVDQNSTNNYGTFDMYINDKLVAKDVNDYWVAHPYGTKYEIKNIKALDGKHYTGVSYGNLVGTIGEGPVAVGLKFDSNKYSVEYIANGGTNGDTPISSHVYGTAKVLTQNGFTKSGYSFSHWNTNEYGTGLDYTDGQEVNNLVSEDGGKIRLYAQWKPNKYSVSVDANNGDSNSNSFYSDTLGRYYELVANKAGFNFAGWSKSDDSLGLFGKKCFANSLYTPVVYNNNGDGMVTVESIDGRSQNYPYGYVNISKITSKGAARPYYGGFVDSVMSSAGKVYIHSFVAKLPKGTMISDFRNPIGDTGYSEWLTNRYGTGEWQWYAYKVVCGDSGRFSNFGHVAIESVDNIATALPTNSNPLVWYIGHHNVIDVTDQNSIHNDTFINLGSNDVVTAQWTQAYDLSEEVNTSVNEESVAPSIDESNSTESNSTETNSTESSVEEVEDNDSSNPSTSEEIVVDSDN